MTAKINLDNKTIEEFQKYQSVIENKEQRREIDIEMIKTYRIYLMENINILLSYIPEPQERRVYRKIISDFIN